MARRAKGRRASGGDRASPIPSRIFAQVSPRSIGGVSLFAMTDPISAANVGAFASEPDLIQRSVLRLKDSGFEVLQVTPTTINIAGPKEAYEKSFQRRIVARELPCRKSGDEDTTATFLQVDETDNPGLLETSGTPFEELIEGIAIEEPRYYFGPSVFPPTKAYWHLRVAGDLGVGLNAERAHRGSTTGKRVRVAMVDSGWYKHPHFTKRGFRVAPVVLGPGAANPLKDESGHGTGESANIFAVAPDAQLLPVKMSFVNATAAFNAAVALRPDIITCSWGSHVPGSTLSPANLALATAIASAVASGIVVIFAAGNGQLAFPGMHPDVISAGGAFMRPDESIQASDYASGFVSIPYPGRRCPDVCGLVGMRPGAQYIMLPVEPGDEIDVTSSGGTHPSGDQTARDDGWAAFSGTSAAAPQVAGAAALILQVSSRFSPDRVKRILMATARDVKVGNSHPSAGGAPATIGVDVATGHGLIDAHRAVLLAKIQAMGNLSVTPTADGSAEPTTEGDDPTESMFTPHPDHIRPIRPIKIGPQPIRIRPGPTPIVGPIRPTPIVPTPIYPTPIRPRPIIGPDPIRPFGSESAAAPGAPERLSEEDVQAMEDLLMESDPDSES